MVLHKMHEPTYCADKENKILKKDDIKKGKKVLKALNKKNMEMIIKKAINRLSRF